MKPQILSLGGGVQSTALYLLSKNGVLPAIDCAIFADTGFEENSTYQTIKQLGNKPEIITCSGVESIEDDETLPVPLFVKGHDGRAAPLRRQCTRDYKVDVVRREIRKRFKTPVALWIGISTDEQKRANPSKVKYIEHRFPLLELGWNRNDCLNYLKENGFGQVQKSACLCCPFRSISEWINLKNNSPEEFKKAVEWEKKQNELFPEKGGVYISRLLVPLEKITGDFESQSELALNCEGYCGI